jgi:hypothetical protein
VEGERKLRGALIAMPGGEARETDQVSKQESVHLQDHRAPPGLVCASVV